MDHLENLLAAQEQDDKKNPKAAKVTRKFIVAEALYMDTGELCPVPKLVEFKVALNIESTRKCVFKKTRVYVKRMWGLRLNHNLLFSNKTRLCYVF